MMMLDEESGVFAACKKRFLEDALQMQRVTTCVDWDQVNW